LEAEGKAIRNREALLAAEEMKKLDTGRAIEEATIAERHRRGLLSEGAYKEELLKIETAFLQKKLALTGLSEVQRDEITKNISLVRADADDARKKERDAAERHYDLVNLSST
jgi:hypothetical protein